jgi:hypothetical protein
MDWKKDLDVLMESTLALVKSVKSEPIAMQRVPSLHVAEQVIAERSEQPMPFVGFEPLPLLRSERDEIKQCVASFRAHQHRVAREREDYYLQMKAKTEALIATFAAPPPRP